MAKPKRARLGLDSDKKVQFGLCASIVPTEPDSDLGFRAAALKGTRWDLKSTVDIRFLDGNKTLWDRVERDSKIWADLTGLTFNFIRSGNAVAPVRVAFSTSFGVQPEEFSSMIGSQARQIRSQFLPTIKLGFTNRVLADSKDTTRLIRHEFGHMMGLIHEHQNPTTKIQFNRDALIAKFAPMGWSPSMVDSQIIQRFDPSKVEATTFDPDSIMLYAFDSSVANPPTKVNYDLSDLDKKLIRRIYQVEGAEDGGTEREDTSAFKRSAAEVGIPLKIGVESDEENYEGPSFPVMWRFAVEDKKKTYVMQTVSDQPWDMILSGPNDPTKEIARDEKSSGPGPNALIEADLGKGVYYLRVLGRIRELRAAVKVRVDPKSS
jgi:hypothetical protein